MPSNILGSLIDFGANLLGNIFGWNINKNTNAANSQDVAATNAANLQIAQNTNAMNQSINDSNIKFQQAENEITRQREDNAVRRRASDMVAAGLSKTLAAGSPAAANALQAPQATLGMEGATMQASRRSAFNPDIRSNFETAMTHKKQLDVADKEADAALLNAETAAQRAKDEAEHWSNQDEETRRHNEAVEAENIRNNDLIDKWHRDSLDQNSKFHDDAMKIDSAKLEIDKLSYLDKHDAMEIENAYIQAQTELTKCTTDEMAARLTADLAESAARVGLYLEETKLSRSQLQQVQANTKYIAYQTAYLIAEKKHLDAQTRQIVANTLTTIYNLLTAKAQHTTTTGTVVSDSVAAQNKANRHTDLAGKLISTGSTILSVGLGAFIGGAPFRVRSKFKDAETLAGMGVWPF